MDYGDIATEMNIGSEDAVRMRHNRAIKKLITRIGGFRPWLDKDFDDNAQDDETPKTELIEAATPFVMESDIGNRAYHMRKHNLWVTVDL
jgi:hypothetical protein